MSFWSRVFNRRAGQEVLPAVRAAVNQEILITNSDELERYLKTGNGTASGAHVTTETALRVAAVYRSNAIVSGAVATLPLRIRRRIDHRTNQDASDHPLWKVLRRRPNKWQKPAEFRRMLQTHVHFRGNGYARKVLSRGHVIGLIPLHPDRVRAEQQPDLSVSYRYRRPDGVDILIPQDEMFHLRGLSLDGVNGLSILGYAREAIGLSLQTEKHGATLFKNGAQLGRVFEMSGQLSPEAYERLKASLDERAGVDNAHRTLILENDMKANTKVAMTSEDAQFLETRKFQRSDIAMFFGVPPHMIGDTEKSTSWGTGIEQQSIGFVTYTLEDWLTMWEEAINSDLIPDNEPDIYAKFTRSALVKGDIKARTEAYVRMLTWGVRSPNEIRELEDENPREGGDVYYDPPNTVGDPQQGETDDDPKPPSD